MKKLIAFLLLASAVFGFGLTITADGPYNPGATVSYTITLTGIGAENVSNQSIDVTIRDSAGAVSTTAALTTNGAGQNTSSLNLSASAISGAWTINANMTSNTSVTNTATFTVKQTPASGTVSANSSYNPGDTVTATLAVLDQAGAGYNGTVNVSLYYGSAPNATNTGVSIASGAGSTTFTLSQYALSGSWNVSVSFNATGAPFTVNSTPRNPGVSASSLSVDKGSTAALNVTVTNHGNFNDTINVNAYASSANITFNASNTGVIGPGASATVAIPLTAIGAAGAGAYPVTVIVNSSANSSNANSTNITATVNPTHVFNISLNQSSATGTPGGSAVQFILTINNNGEASEAYSVSCASNRSWTCTPSTSSPSANANSSVNVTLSVYVPQNELQGTNSNISVNVTSATYGSSFLNTTNFTVAAGASAGGSLNFFGTEVTNTYWVKASTSRNFTFAVNNTGNTNATYNVTITAGTGNLTVSGGCGSATIGALSSSNLSCSAITGLNYSTVSVTMASPANATPCASTSIGFSLINSSGSAIDTKTITAKAPCFTSAPVLTFNPSTGSLIVQIAAVLREGVALAAANISSLTYSILSPALATLTTGPANLSATYTLNYSSTTTYPSALNYTIAVAVTDNSSANYSSGSLRYRFKLVRSVTVAGTSAVSTISGAAFSLSYTSKYDSGDDVGAPTITGINCGSASGTSTYTYSCTAPAVTTTGYASTSAITSCVYDTNASCTLTSALSSSTPITVTISTILLPPQQQGGGGGGGGGNATANVTQNLTAGASQSVNISMPATANITGAGNLTITVSNLANVTQLINTSLEELGDYSHFMLNISAPENISAGANATFTVNITPYAYARPGTYTVTVDVLGQKKNYTVTVPSPAYSPDAVNVNRYIETAKNRSSSVVYLEIVNKKFETVNVTIREVIPKTLANSTAGVTFLTPYTTVVEDDPVVEWTLSLAPGETVDIRYSVKKDATNASFSAPEVTETLPPAPIMPVVEVGQPSADNTWTLVLIGIVVIVGAVFAYLYFVERPLFYRLLQEARFKADGALKWLKK